jgi:uncharacterized membrane protein YphA (DoxX/SURF4 family)
MSNTETRQATSSRKGGVFFVIARLLVGVVFIWMGITKTGLVTSFLHNTRLMETSAVQYVVQNEIIDLSNPVDFLKLIREYHIIPESMPMVLNLVAAVLPWLEVLCGIFLVLGVGIRGTSLLIVILMTAFTVMVTSRALHIYNIQDIAFCDIKFDCGCGAGVVYICYKIPENLFLLAVSLGLLFSRSRRLCLKRDLVTANGGKTSS